MNRSQTVELNSISLPILRGLRSVEANGTPSVEVKFVDIWGNTRGESGSPCRF